MHARVLQKDLWGAVNAPDQALVLEAARDLAEGELVYMDYGAAGAGDEAAEKLDSQVLLDYGAFDAGSNQVRAGSRRCCPLEDVISNPQTWGSNAS